MTASSPLQGTIPATKRRLVLCLDGTWNSTYELKDYLERLLKRNDKSLDAMLKAINEEAANRQTPPIEPLNRHTIIKLLAHW